jgi:hypothetical protein
MVLLLRGTMNVTALKLDETTDPLLHMHTEMQ